MKAAKRWQPKQKAGKPSLRSFILCYNQCFVLNHRIILPEQAKRLHTLPSQPADRKPFTGNLLAFSAKCLTSVSNLFPITSIPGRSLAGVGNGPGGLRAGCFHLATWLITQWSRQPAFHHLLLSSVSLIPPFTTSPSISLLSPPFCQPPRSPSPLPFFFHPFIFLLLCALSTFGPRALSPVCRPPKLITPVPRHTLGYGRAQHFLLGLRLSLQNAFCNQSSPSPLWTEVSLSPSSLPPSLSLPHIIFSI